MMPNRREKRKNSIPIQFLDDESSAPKKSADAQDSEDMGRNAPTPDEMGRASSYEDETEMQRRIDRGADEDESRANESDVAGGPPMNEVPERREERDEAETSREAAPRSAAEEKGIEQREAAASTRPQTEAYGPVLAELVATRAELKRVETERGELLDKLARRQADFDNYRKRNDRERGETYNRMVADMVKKLLPVVDNLRRALDAESSVKASESAEFRHFLNGVELIAKQLDAALESMGLQVVEAVGQPFDPHVHEAVMTGQSDEFEPDTVMQEIVRGYKLGEKLLRPAMVKVAVK